MNLSLALGKLAGMLAPLLVPLKVPDPDPVPIPGLKKKANTILGALEWIGIVAGVGAVIIVAITLMMSFHRGEGGERAKSLVAVCIGLILIGSASAFVKFFV